MAVPIASLFIDVSADVSAAIGGLNALNNRLSSTKNAFDQAKPAALALTAAAGGIGAGFASAVNVAADFEHQMSGVKAVMSTDEVDQFGVALSDLALKLGRDTVFTSREAAAGIEELIKAGVPAGAVLDGAAKAATDLAAATGIPVADAATIAAQAINIFGKDASNLTPVVDRLAAVANASASDVSFLKFGLAAAGGVAAGFGVSLDDTLVTLGLLSNRFATGADAGTSFKTFLNGLTPDTKKQNAEFRRLGLITEDGSNKFFDAAHNVKSMAGVAGVLRSALSGLNAEQRQTSLQILFGTDAQRAANALYELGGEKIQAFKDQTAGSGVAAQSATTRLDNLQGSLGQLGGSFETVQITVGNFFLPALRGIVDAAKGALDAFGAMSPGAQAVVVGFLGIVGAAAGLAGGVGLIGLAIKTFGPSFLALGKILLSLAPAFRIATVVAAVLAGAWATNLFGIRDKVQAAFDAIPGILDRVGKAFQSAGDFWNTTIAPALQNIADTVTTKFGEISAAVQASGLGQLIGDVFGVVADVFQAIIDGRGGEIIDFFKNLLPQPFKDLGAAIGTTVGDTFGVISDVFQAIIDGRGNEIVDFFKDKLPQPFKDLGAALEGPVTNAFGVIGDVFQAIVDGRGNEIVDFFKDRLPQPFKDLGATIGSTVGPVFQSIGLIFSDIVNGNGDLVLMFFKKLLPESFVTLGAAIGENVGNAFQTISALFAAVVRGDGQLVLDFFGALLPQALQDFITKADQGPAVINKLAESIKTIQTSIAGFDPAQLATVGEAIGGSFLNTLGQIGTQLAPLLTVFQSVGTFLGSVANVFTAFADLRAKQTAAGQGAAGEDPLTSSLQKLADFMANNGGLGENFVKMLGPFGAPLSGLIAAGDAATTLDSMANALNNFAQAIRSFPAMPDWLSKFLGGDRVGALLSFGQQGAADLRGQAGSGQINPNSLVAGGAAGPGGGPIVAINQVILGAEVDAQKFISDMAAAVRAAAGRVNAPPDNSAFPALVTP